MEVFDFSLTNEGYLLVEGRCPLVEMEAGLPSAAEKDGGPAAGRRFVLNLLSHLRVISLLSYSEFSERRFYRNLDKRKYSKVIFKCFKTDAPDISNQNLVKVEMTILCNHQIKPQWSVRPKWFVLVKFIAKCQS